MGSIWAPIHIPGGPIQWWWITVTYDQNLGVAVAGVTTNNGACYRSKTFQDACRDLGIRHIRTMPYSPKTNGKAERFIQTALREWAYARVYDTSDRRTDELPIWLHRYKTPVSCLALAEGKLLRLHN